MLPWLLVSNMFDLIAGVGNKRSTSFYLYFLFCIWRARCQQIFLNCSHSITPLTMNAMVGGDVDLPFNVHVT